MKKFRTKRIYFLLFLALLVIEILIAKYVNDSFIRPYLGDVIVVILIYAFVRAVSNLSAKWALIATLLFSILIEFLQAMQIINILGLEKFKLARIVIGTSFSWLDIVCYIAGCCIVLAIEWRLILSKKEM